MATTAPFGTWESPITAADVVQDNLRLSDCSVEDGTVYWSEGRPAEGGRACIVARTADGACHDLLPASYSARSSVHEYGGLAYAVRDGILYFVNFTDQRLYRVVTNLGRAGSGSGGAPGEPEPISPEPAEPRSVRYAAPVVSGDGRFVYCIRERHAAPSGEGQSASAAVINDLVVLPSDGEGEPRLVAGGHDFFSSLTLSPDGSRLAWICWDHPQMPWDGTQLWEADLGQDGLPTHPRLITGSTEESVTQPRYSPQGQLHFISDRTGFWNIYRDGGEPARALRLWAADADFAQPDWVFGRSSYAFLPDGSLVATWIEAGIFKIGHLANQVLSPIGTDLTSIDSVRGAERSVVAIVGSPAIPGSVASIEIPSGETEILRSGSNMTLDSAYISQPEPVEFPTAGGLTAYGLLYRPCNVDYSGPEGELPPLIVTSHGGPTSMADPSLNFGFQYFTTRGFAVVDVNYGGSSGYGREYRNRLAGSWGIVDLADCNNAAKYLADAGIVDRRRMGIRGGSASGYTTLCAAVFSDVFAVGASYFGVADLGALARDTHKFESRYTDGLVAPWPEGKEVYEERSPSFHAELLHMPLIIFQGLDDAVVPPAQSDIMAGVLREKSIPFAYLSFEGEGHGFRRAATVIRCLEAELSFYGQILGFQPAGAIEPVEIENAAGVEPADRQVR